MPENTPEQEPSIEEILASIRQIISDDDEEGEAVAEPEEVVEEIQEPEEPEEREEEILELTNAIEEEPAEEEEEFSPPVDTMPQIDMRDREEPVVNDMTDEILSDATKAAALSSISKLAGSMPIGRTPSHNGVTLEDIVRELLNPMLREWMDDNLNDIVERKVQKELEKLARRAMDN